MRSIRTWWLVVAFLSGMVLAMGVEELILSAHDNRLEFSTPVHFLSDGRPLARLKNAFEVPFAIKTTLSTGSRNNLFRQATGVFKISWDLFDQDYSVVALQPRKTKSHLTADAAEKWCLDQVSLDITGLSGSDQIWTTLDIRAEVSDPDGGLFGRGEIGDSGISLTRLLETLSRPARPQQPHWNFAKGPVRLDQLRRTRGT